MNRTTTETDEPAGSRAAAPDAAITGPVSDVAAGSGSSDGSTSDSAAPIRKLIEVPAAAVRVGDWVCDQGVFRAVVRAESVQAHVFGGPYSPVISYVYVFEKSASHVGSRLSVRPGQLVAVWRSCE
jgi:hypothetical protein